MTPILSVVIPSHCRADLLAECLESLRLHAPPRVEIIVVDDASAEGIVSTTALRFPNVRVVRLARQSGFCVAANVGIATATAPVVEMLNDDTEVTAGWAEAALRCFDDPKVVAVAPLVLQLDPERRAAGSPPLIDSAGDTYDSGGFATKRWHGRSLSERAVRKCEPVWGTSASAAFYRRAALLDAGGFPHDFGAYFEDVDLAHRLNRAGGITLFQPACVVWHRVSASYGRSPSREVLVRQSRNEERVFWRNITGLRLLWNLPRHAAVLLGKAYLRMRERTFRPWMRGRLQAWGIG